MKLSLDIGYTASSTYRQLEGCCDLFPDISSFHLPKIDTYDDDQCAAILPRAIHSGRFSSFPASFTADGSKNKELFVTSETRCSLSPQLVVPLSPCGLFCRRIRLAEVLVDIAKLVCLKVSRSIFQDLSVLNRTTTRAPWAICRYLPRFVS